MGTVAMEAVAMGEVTMGGRRGAKRRMVGGVVWQCAVLQVAPYPTKRE
jgi:hypothetical protein